MFCKSWKQSAKIFSFRYVLAFALLLLLFGIEVMLIFVTYIPHFPPIDSDT